jgi:hypothetical protein
MAQQYPEWIWQNGSIKPWQEATTHVMSHALHYGSSVFEASAAMPHRMVRPFSGLPTICIGCISRRKSTTWCCRIPPMSWPRPAAR